MPGFFQSIGNLFTGTPEKHKRVSTLLKEQQPLANQLFQAGQATGVGGVFGNAADYYRGLLGNNETDFNAFAAPQLRQYYQDTVPSISEQFAGMGSGGLSSSGFNNAQAQGGVDLAERLGAIRANLRQAGAQGLQNIGQLGLGNFSQDIISQQGTSGLLAPALGSVGTAIGGPALGALGAGAGNWLSNKFGSSGNQVGANTSPYGNLASQGALAASPTIRR